MYKFDSEAMIKELEEIYGVDESLLDYEEFEGFMEHKEITERELKNDL